MRLALFCWQNQPNTLTTQESANAPVSVGVLFTCVVGSMAGPCQR